MDVRAIMALASGARLDRAAATTAGHACTSRHSAFSLLGDVYCFHSLSGLCERERVFPGVGWDLDSYFMGCVNVSRCDLMMYMGDDQRLVYVWPSLQNSVESIGFSVFNNLISSQFISFWRIQWFSFKCHSVSCEDIMNVLFDSDDGSRRRGGIERSESQIQGIGQKSKNGWIKKNFE